MQPTDTSAAERILADRARYVAPGMSTPRLVVAHAEGARVTDPDGRSFIDFAGGIGCQNTGHRHAAIVEAIKEQADRYLHQCFMIGVYEPYVEVCRRLAELSPCGGRRAAVDPRELRRRGGRERGEDRALGHRPAGGRRLRQRVPRTDAAGDDDDEQGEAVQGRVRPVRARGLPRAVAVPVPRDLVRRLDRGARAPLQGRRRPVDGRVPRPRAGAGRGRVPRDAAGLSGEAPGALPQVRDPVGERRGPVRCRAHRDDVGDRAVRGGRARHDRVREVDRRRSPARRRDRRRRGHGRGSARRSRRDVRRQPALLRGRARRPRRRDGARASSRARASSA